MDHARRQVARPDLFELGQFSGEERLQVALHLVRPRAADVISGRQPSTESALARVSAKSSPARCSLASAAPKAAQWVADGRLITCRRGR